MPLPQPPEDHGTAPRLSRKKQVAWIAGLAVVGVVATAGGAAWWAQRRVQTALADVVHLQQQVTALQTTLTGYTRYTS